MKSIDKYNYMQYNVIVVRQESNVEANKVQLHVGDWVLITACTVVPHVLKIGSLAMCFDILHDDTAIFIGETQQGFTSHQMVHKRDYKVIRNG